MRSRVRHGAGGWARRGATRLAIVAIGLVHAAAARGQSGAIRAPAPRVELASTQVRTLHSAANDVDYTLYVSLPPGYDTASARYPVVYLLDADYSFPVAHAVAWHLTERSHLPPVILVGIAYDGPPQYRLNRTRDYTPTFQPDGGYGPETQRVSGGGPKFLDFLARELVPFVESRYRATSDRTLVGHSYGGLFTLWTALTAPTLFNRVLAVSPSLWYADHLLTRVEQSQRAAGGGLPARIYMTVGSREGNAQQDMVVDLRTFAKVLEDRRDPRLVLRSEVLEDETHNSIFPGALGRGLRFLFADMGAR